MAGIERSLEVFDDLEKIAGQVFGITKQGLGLGSSLKVLELLRHAVELVKDAQAALPELADLDAQESGRLAERAFGLVKAIILSVKV